MKKVSIMLLGFLLVLASGKAYAMAQLTMVNKSQLPLNLYIDGNFGCGPVPGIGHFTNSPGLFCTSSVTPGPHQLEARNGEKVVAHEDNVNIGDGTSPTWTVNYEEPVTVEGVWRIQSSFDSDREVIEESYTIVREGEGYRVKESSPNPAEYHQDIGLYYGTPGQIMNTFTPSFENLVLAFFGLHSTPSNQQRSVLRQLEPAPKNRTGV